MLKRVGRAAYAMLHPTGVAIRVSDKTICVSPYIAGAVQRQVNAPALEPTARVALGSDHTTPGRCQSWRSRWGSVPHPGQREGSYESPVGLGSERAHDTNDAHCSTQGIAPAATEVDVEGAEIALFRGTAETLRRHRVTVVFDLYWRDGTTPTFMSEGDCSYRRRCASH
jgi:hypothetical protein